MLKQEHGVHCCLCMSGTIGAEMREKTNHVLNMRRVNTAAGAVGAHQHHALVVAQGRRQERLRRRGHNSTHQLT